MSVKYSEKAREEAKSKKLHLVTVSAFGVTFQAGVPKAVANEIAHKALDLQAEFESGEDATQETETETPATGEATPE